jgi:hypothetical protein
MDALERAYHVEAHTVGDSVTSGGRLRLTKVTVVLGPEGIGIIMRITFILLEGDMFDLRSATDKCAQIVLGLNAKVMPYTGSFQ